jgi:hypothetical protein
MSLCSIIITVAEMLQKNRNEGKRKMLEVTQYYVVEFVWTNEKKLPAEDEFFPVMIYRLHELADMLSEYYRYAEREESPYIVKTIRPANDDEVRFYPHYYD